ncbi:type II toxin-antitoxin system PemK/MazF family toxin [Ligilactobacillus sp. LYQ139]|uniref:type II toxin-antitoxin system PemK/MazF family toxin n=1 Tax=Ligilactobacillus sp. LYQ139 TaxID=3378800 RepID=UPI0038534520
MKMQLKFFSSKNSNFNSNEEKLIKRSSHRFLEISKNDEWKSAILPNWLDNVSYWLDKENKNDLPKGYYYYERGTIIRVDFGVNMGSEFCGLHFAIVLDKKDNNQKKTLTVVPLTSKNKGGRFSLGKEIFNQTTHILNQRTRELQEQTNILFAKTKKLFLSGVNDVNKKNALNIELDHCFDEGKYFRDDIEKLIYDGNYDTNKIKQLFQEALTNKKEIENLNKVINVYSRYNKNTYVRLSDITTISKLRIRKINKYDPSGKIKLTTQQMAAISDKLMKLYISK